ncbi:fatty acid desaturase [Paraburkholderia strydomiana]|uniref:Fatty acid desaturase n=1 Tax=Paraburkholderia strydomiana TaxID=1245417 RepID=A0ABW9EI23_9BURK
MFESGTRESMRGFPSIFQPFVTWVTGKPLTATELRFVIPRPLDVLFTIASSVAILAALIRLAGQQSISAWALIVMLWLVLVGLLRKMQVTHLHHAIHNRLFARASLNRLYARILPSLIFVQNGTEYRKEHLEHHNADIFTTRQDADAAFLAKLGFLPGRERGELWTNLWLTVASPAFHILFARARLTSVFLRNKPAETLVALFVAAMHITLLVISGWRTYLIAIVMPMFVLYHVSALLQFLTEHAWNVVGEPVNDWSEYSSRCWGRFSEKSSRRAHSTSASATIWFTPFGCVDGPQGWRWSIFRFEWLVWYLTFLHTTGIIWHTSPDRTPGIGRVVSTYARSQSQMATRQASHGENYGGYAP